MTREEYLDYLSSEHWQETRKAAYARAEYRCQVCNASGVQLEAHHRTYARIGAELPEDLFVLCEDCHNLFSQNGRLAEVDYEEEDEDCEDNGREKLQVLRNLATTHPRWSLGGSTALFSFAVDLFVHFNPVAVVAGIGAVVIVSWKADGVVEEVIQFLAPGSKEGQIQAMASHIAARTLDDYPVYRDQRLIAKLRRLVGQGDYSVASAVEEDQEDRDTPAKSLPVVFPKRAVVKQSPSQRAEKMVLSDDLATAWFNDGRIDVTQYFDLLERVDRTSILSPDHESSETVKPPERPGKTGETLVKSHPLSLDVSPVVSPEDEALIVRTAFTLQAQNNRVTREDIKAALGWNNKRHGEIKVTCDKYGIAMPPGGGK